MRWRKNSGWCIHLIDHLKARQEEFWAEYYTIRMKNIVANEGILKGCRTIRDIPKCHDDSQIALICGGGPSFDRCIASGDIDLLKGCYIVAVDRAVKPLVERGITPGLVISLDPSEKCKRWMDIGDRSEGIPIALCVSTHPDAVECWKGRPKYFYNPYNGNGRLNGVLMDKFVATEFGVPTIYCYGHSGSLAIELLAEHLLYKHIAMIGVDMVYDTTDPIDNFMDNPYDPEARRYELYDPEGNRWWHIPDRLDVYKTIDWIRDHSKNGVVFYNLAGMGGLFDYSIVWVGKSGKLFKSVKEFAEGMGLI